MVRPWMRNPGLRPESISWLVPEGAIAGWQIEDSIGGDERLRTVGLRTPKEHNPALYGWECAAGKSQFS
jgi:hypothetical protein